MSQWEEYALTNPKPAEGPLGPPEPGKVDFEVVLRVRFDPIQMDNLPSDWSWGTRGETEIEFVSQRRLA